MYVLGVYVAPFSKYVCQLMYFGNIAYNQKDIRLCIAMKGQSHKLPQRGRGIPVGQSLLLVSQGFQIINDCRRL